MIKILYNGKFSLICIYTIYYISYVEGESVKLECRATAEPAPQVVWLHNGTAIAASEKFVIARDGDFYSLTLPKSLPAQSGRYTARISNKFGKEETSTEISIKVEGILHLKVKCTVQKF